MNILKKRLIDIRKLLGLDKPYKRIVDMPETRRGKIAYVKTNDAKYVFDAKSYDKGVSDADIERWMRGITWKEVPNVVVNIRGLSMNKQYGLARKLRSKLKPEQRKKILIDDGPYESSARMIEQYIQE